MYSNELTKWVPMDSCFRAAAFRTALLFLFSLILNLGSSSFGSPLPCFSPVQPTDSTFANPEEQLAHCVEIAKSGRVKEAFDSAMSLHQQFKTLRLFDVSYIDTLLTIAEEPGSKLDAVILNEVIGLVNEIRVAKKYDGVQDAEVSFRFMKALGRLSEVTLEVNEKISSKVRVYEGLIALNLAKNPEFPKNATEALSLPLVSMSKGYALRGDKGNAFKALRVAVDKGFGDFELIAKDPVFSRLGESEIAKLTKELKVRYKKAVRLWAQTVVAEFQASQLFYDLPGINGGRISNADFAGKIVVMDLWATWCPPCRRGIPHFIELQEKYGGKNLSVLGVSMDNPQDSLRAIETVRKFASDQKFNYPCAMGNELFSQGIPGERVLPTMVFLDSFSNIRYVARGYHDYAKLEAITKVLLNESQPVRTTLPSMSN